MSDELDRPRGIYIEKGELAQVAEHLLFGCRLVTDAAGLRIFMQTNGLSHDVVMQVTFDALAKLIHIIHPDDPMYDLKMGAFS